MIVVDSPPGITRPSRPSSSSGSLTSATVAPSLRSAAACSRNAPCRARTPMRSDLSTRALPAANFEPLALGERARGDADHRLPETGRDVGEHLRVVVVRRRLDDRLRARLGIAGLEDPRP